MQRFHYGMLVDSEEPITGVFSQHVVEWLGDDLNDGDDPNYSDARDEARTSAEAEGEEFDEEDFAMGYEETYTLIGFNQDEEGTWFPDPNAEYSAIYSSDNGGILQVVASKWGIRCGLCSPCYPGQGDGEVEGDFLAFSPPPDVVGDIEAGLKERIFKLP